jgi:hypothetical protein
MKKNIKLLIVLALVSIAITAFCASKNYSGSVSNVIGIPAATYDADKTGEAIEVGTHKGAIITCIASGTFSSTNSIKFELEHSASSTAGTFEDVETGDVIGAEFDTGGQIASFQADVEGGVKSVSYLGGKQYIRVIMNASGTVSDEAGAIVTKIHPYISQ